MQAKQFCVLQQQNLGRRFGSGKMHSIPPPTHTLGILGCCLF